MEGLILRLSALDADAENALRVIGFFDQMITGPTDVDTLVRNAARLAECPAGVRVDGGLFVRADPSGRLSTAGKVPASAIRRKFAGGMTIWLERASDPLPLDAMVLERFAITAAALLDHSRVPAPELGDPALVELALSDSAGIAERSRALQLLGLAPTTPVFVLAVRSSTTSGFDEVVAALGGRPAGVRTADLGQQRAALVSWLFPDTEPHIRPPAGTIVGIAERTPAIEAPRAWRSARTAVRLGTAVQPVVRAAELGGFALLAERLTAADIATVADVTALDQLARGASGAETLDILIAVEATDSVRKAAAAVFRHHSTVAARLALAESVLGFRVDTPAGRARLQLALVLRRIRDTAGPT
ncbi:helix-turn-helix domain-containing protein [Fodinicola feengrottensis]|uniref:Helix-turn-helix domain-containing protein n=1 Tax=Fodinicola feengrottensis TaxID=435914 RepID=A0ABN2FV65_9ACTN